GAQGVARGAVPDRLPGAQRRRVAQAHRRGGQRRRRATGELFAGDDHPVGATGKDLLVPEYTLKIRRFDPEAGEAAYWDEHTVDLDGTQSVLDAILKVRDDV